MDQSGNKPLLIATRLRATAALCLAGFFALRRLWFLLRSHTTSHFALILPFNSIYPNWVAAALNLFFYGYTIWLMVLVCSRLKGEERVFLAIWIAEILAHPLRSLASVSVASTMAWAQFFGDVVMVVAAVLIYQDISVSGSTEPESAPSDCRD
jgi:hypothetical protein